MIEDSPYYSIKTTAMDVNTRLNDLESVVSTLSWNMSAWPDQMLDRMQDNANYTCRSTANSVGPGVSSTTVFTVECELCPLCSTQGSVMPCSSLPSGSHALCFTHKYKLFFTCGCKSRPVLR